MIHNQKKSVSTLEHLQISKCNRTRCHKEKASAVGIPHPLQMFYGNLAQFGENSNSVLRSSSATGSNIGVMSDRWRVSVYDHPPEYRVTFGRGGLHIV